MNCSPVRTPRKPVFNFLQNIAASNSVPASTWFTTRGICRRYFTHGHPDLVRAPQAAFTDHVNAFGVFNKLGKVFPSASSQKEFIGYVVITESTDSYPMIKVPATEARYPSHPELVNCNARVLARIAGQCIVMTKPLYPESFLYEMPIVFLVDDRVGTPRSCWTVAQETTRWYHALESWNGRPIKTKTSRSSTRHRCCTNRMGSSSQWKAGNRLSEQTRSANTFKLPRVVGHRSSHKSFRERLKVQKSASVI